MERARTERQQRLAQPPSSNQPPPLSNREPHARSTGETDGTGIQLQYRRKVRLSFDPYAFLNGRLLRLQDNLGLAGIHEGVAEAYRILRTQILHRLSAKSYRTLAITSPRRGDGKTTTAINLAIGLARDTDQKVLLVDFDLKHPSIGRYFTRHDSPGVIDYLMGDAELEDVLVNPGIERLMILPGHTRLRDAPKRFSCLPLAPRIEALKHQATDWLILFDMPPLFAGDDVIPVLHHVDAVMLVVADGKVSHQELVDAHELLGKQCIGMVLNKAGPDSGSPGYDA